MPSLAPGQQTSSLSDPEHRPAHAVAAPWRELVATAEVAVFDEPFDFVDLAVTPEALSLPVGGAAQLAVEAIRPGGERVDVTLDPRTGYEGTPGVVEALPAGLVLGLAPGSGEVAVQYGPLERRAAVEVRSDSLEIVRLEIAPRSVRLAPGEAVELRVTAFFDDGSQADVTGLATYLSLDPRVALALPGGRVEGVRPGSTSIRVTAAGATDEFRVLVDEGAEVVSLAIRPSRLRIEAGSAGVIEVRATFSSGLEIDVTFEPETVIQSNNPRVADWYGRTIQGRAEGFAFIEATYRGVRALAEVSVDAAPPPPLVGIRLLGPASLGLMESAPLFVLGDLASGASVDLTGTVGLSLSSDTPSVADIQGGRVVGLSPGRALLTARFGGFVATSPVEVRPPPTGSCSSSGFRRASCSTRATSSPRGSSPSSRRVAAST